MSLERDLERVRAEFLYNEEEDQQHSDDDYCEQPPQPVYRLSRTGSKCYGMEFEGADAQTGVESYRCAESSELVYVTRGGATGESAIQHSGCVLRWSAIDENEDGKLLFTGRRESTAWAMDILAAMRSPHVNQVGWAELVSFLDLPQQLEDLERA